MAHKEEALEVKKKSKLNFNRKNGKNVKTQILVSRTQRKNVRIFMPASQILR